MSAREVHRGLLRAADVNRTILGLGGDGDRDSHR